MSKLRDKPKHFKKFYEILLLISGDMSLNPDPCQMQFNDEKIWETLKTRDLHICHLNVNSLSKIDKLRNSQIA